MKKRFLAVLLALCMTLSLLPVAALADGTTAGDTAGSTQNAAKIGSQEYATLADAIAAVEANETIELLRDVPDAEGISVASNKNFTVDFKGHTYTLVGPGAGSTNTETNAFQLLKNSTITFKDGTIKIAANANRIQRIFQSYANVTLEDMKIYAENQVGGEAYALSFNNGDVTFKGNTSVYTTSKDTIAFDVCYWLAGGYTDGVSVTFDNSYTGTINGKILYDSADAEKGTLIIGGSGTFGGIGVSSASTADPAITITGGTFSSDVSAYVSGDYAMVSSGDSYTVKAMNTVLPGTGTVRLNGDVALGDSVDITGAMTLDLNGHSIKPAEGYTGSDSLLLVHRGATLTINDSVGTGSIVAALGNARCAVKLTVAGDTPADAKAVLTVNGGKLEGSSFGIAGNGTRNGTEVTINGGEVVGTTGTGLYHPQDGTLTITGGTITGLNAGVEVRSGTVDISGGKLVSRETEYTEAANGNGTTVSGAGLAISQHATKQAIDVTITGGEFAGPAALSETKVQNQEGTVNVRIVEISAGDFNGEVKSQSCTEFITGGYFTQQPDAKYLAANKTAVGSDKSGYTWMIGEAPKNDVKPAVGAPDVTVDETKFGDSTDAVETAAESVKSEDLAAYAATAAGDVSETDVGAAKKALDDANIKPDSGETVTVYAQAYLAVEPTAYENGTLTMDITPKYRLVASTAETADEIVLKAEGVENANAVALDGSDTELKVTGSVTISVTLPDNFTVTGDKVYVQHKDTYEYEATVKTVDGKKVATFTNPHGFSTFTISATSQTVAKIGDVSYTSYKAVAAAAQNGDTITLMEAPASENPFTIYGKSVTVKLGEDVTGENWYENVRTNGTVKYDEDTGTLTITYIPPYIPPTPPAEPEKPAATFTDVVEGAYYSDAVAWAVEQGITGGTTPTTFSPDLGCNRGQIVMFLWRQAGMPEPQSAANPFTDVAEGDYYYKAVLWAVEQGITGGTTPTTFSPNKTCTRAETVTFLWRANGQPAPTKADQSFTDVPADAYYSAAVLWALEQGITGGTTPTTFSPAKTCTRGEVVTFLYRCFAE